ncbi:MAG: c-type cytochrome domain-containing protein, partial [Verrucomicrobiota bacterium]
MSRPIAITGIWAIMAWNASLHAAPPDDFNAFVAPFLEQYCLDCHDAETEKGGVSLEDLTGVDAANAGLWKSVWEQVALKDMPPRKKKNQPDGMDRVKLSNWITGRIEQAMKDQGGFALHHHPTKANHLDHGLLFGKLPDGLEPSSSPARIWRVTPQEHLVRLNELINTEPTYNPSQPGLRTRGDMIPWNTEGEVKVYYALDRILGQEGGSAAYIAAITGFPPILSKIRDPGLKNYPSLYSVNGAEATQIARHAEEIIRYMAYGPRGEPFQFVADRKAYKKPDKFKGLDMRGTT